jgi:hypothetical protein
MTPTAYRHPEAPPADIPVVVPWAAAHLPNQPAFR